MIRLDLPTRGFTPKAVSPNGNGNHAHAVQQSKALILNPALFGTNWINNPIGTSLGGLTVLRAYWLAYACMDYRKTKLVEPPLWIKEETEDAPRGEWLRGEHELSDLLERPNPDMRMREFLEIVSLNLDASDRGCLIVKSYDNAGRVASMYPFGGDAFEVRSTPDRLRGLFIVHTATGREEYGPEDVIWIRNTDPSDLLGSLPPLRHAMEHLGIGREMVRAIQSAMLRTINPGSVVTLTDTPNEDDLDVLKASINSSHAGAMNFGKLMLLTGGAKWEAVGNGLKDLDLGPVQDDIEAAVCAVFKVHPLLIGTKLGLTANAGMSDATGPMKELFYDNVAFPTWSNIEDALTDGLLRPIDPNPRRFIRFDTEEVRALRADLTKRTVEASQATGYWTINEQRVHSGQAPLEGEEGEALSGNASRAPLDLSGIFGNRQPEPPTEEPDEDEEEDEEEERRLQLVKARRESKANRRTTWAIMDAVTRSFEAYIETLAAGQIAEDQREILARMEGRTKADPTGPLSREEAERIRKAIDDYLTNESPEQWRLRLWPPIEAAARLSVERTAASLGISFDLVQPGLASFVEKEVGFLVTHVSETTRESVRKHIGEGMAAGETTSTIAKRLREAGEFSPARARLIARTESTRATNGATVETMGKYAKDNGLKVQKSWLTANDARVRDEHAAMEGETVPIDQPFSNGRMHPDEPNCRCSVTTEVSV